VPWQPDDYIHRIGRTGRAGMKGIAITLASRADGEAIGRIEKLIGHQIPRAVGADAEGPAEAQRPPKAAKPQKPESKPAAAPKVQPPRKQEGVRATERSPVVEDLASEWNGPMPSFLSVSAGE
jgi:superfamily II DNA/RNA helicase